MSIMQIFIIILILLLFDVFIHMTNAASLPCTSTPPTTEINALQGLFSSTNGANWNWQSTLSSGSKWNFQTTPVNPCATWQGVVCYKTSTSAPCHVNTLVLVMSYNLNGTLPSVLGNLIYLNTLQLANNPLLTGSIPNSIGALNQLIFLSLYSNNLTGSIPETIGDMDSLEYLELNYNRLSGTIPSSITRLNVLTELSLFDNKLRGNIPKDIGNMTSLKQLELYNNQLTGTIPTSITKLNQLSYLYIQNNTLRGSIPKGIENLSSLTQFYLYNNQFTGTIPNSICKMTRCAQIIFSNNKFYGSIPKDIGNITNLKELDLNSNLLTGSIPKSLDNCRKLSYLVLFGNVLHGSLTDDPSMLLEYVDFSFNEFTGTIPLTSYQSSPSASVVYFASNLFTGNLSMAKNIGYFDVSQNYFTGDLNWMNLALMPDARDCILSDNLFSGTLPSSMGKYLTYFAAHNNLLVGSIPNTLFNPANQNILYLIDFSKNSLTGSIPDYIFQLPRLSYFAAAQNCFSGTIPTTLCKSSATLETLILDGLHSAKSCEQRLFPGIPSIHTLAPSSAITGNLPPCVYSEMGVLQLLHAAGNMLTGSLPDLNENLGAKLSQLSLSHNELVGTIPLAFQQHGFTELDLSFNKLTGELSKGINVKGFIAAQEGAIVTNNSSSSNSSGLSLNNNRLSGSVPSNLLNLQNIDLLTGNMFGCDEQDRISTLPEHDEAYATYICGSDETNNALISYGSVFVAMLVVVGLSIWWAGCQRARKDSDLSSNIFAKFIQQLHSYMIYQPLVHHDRQNEQEVDLQQKVSRYGAKVDIFVLQQQRLQNYVVCLTAVLASMLLLCYGLLGIYYSSYSHKYVWVISISYLSGTIPGVSLLVIMIVIMFVLFVDMQNILKHTGNNVSQRLLVRMRNLSFREALSYYGSSSMKTDETPKQKILGLYSKKGLITVLILLGLVLIDVAIVITINAIYVSLILSGISTSQQSILAIALSLFKDGWRMVVMRSMKLKVAIDAEELFGGGEAVVTRLLLGVILFNNIIAPAIATALVNRNCFYYALVPDHSVSAADSFSYCEPYYYVSLQCGYYRTLDIITSFKPPFVYSYQCTSTLLANFASVWIYMFLFGGIVTPMGKTLWFAYSLQRAVAKVKKCKLNTDPNKKEKKIKFPAFQCQALVLSLCNNLTVMLCFGVLFPPIMMMGCVAILMQTTLQKIQVLYTVDILKLSFPEDVDLAFNGCSIKNNNKVEIEGEGKEVFGTSDLLDVEILSESLGYQQQLGAESHTWADKELEKLNVACSDMAPSYANTVDILIVYLSLVWGIFLWDMVGDEVGMWQSIWVFALMVAAALFLQMQSKLCFWRPHANPAVEERHVEVELSTITTVENPLALQVAK